jgi:hypothetical protein
VSEYDVGPATATPLRVNEAAPTTTDQSAIEGYLFSRLDPPSSGWPLPDGNTLYVLYYPSSTTISDGGCTSFAGYHSCVQLSNGMCVPYAVLPRCGDLGLDPLDELTLVTTHELAEAATDPFVGAASAYSTASDFAWVERAQGGEIGDMCQYKPGNALLDPQLGNYVERMWSNVEAAAGHDPCVPHPDGDVYFNAAPAAEEMVTVSFPANFPAITTPGFHIPVHGSRTVDVELFSDAGRSLELSSNLRMSGCPGIERQAATTTRFT